MTSASRGCASRLLAMVLAGALPAACTSYHYQGLTASVDASHFDDAKLVKLPAGQRIRIAEALSICNGSWEQIYSIKNAQATGTQRWKSASLLVTALGTAAIATGLLINNHNVTVDSASGHVDVSDPAASRWATGLGLLTVGVGATGAFVLSMSSSEAELDTLQPLLPQIEGARTALRSALSSNDPAVVDRQIAQLEETCDGARQRVASYNRDETLAAQFGSEAVKALDREITRRVQEADSQGSGAVMDTVAATRRFGSLARAVGFTSARIIGQPWQVGAGGERRHAVPLASLVTDLKKLAAANVTGQIAIAVFTPNEGSPPAFNVSVALVGGDSLKGSDGFLPPARPLVAPAVDFELGGLPSAAGTALSLAPYTQSLPSTLSGWVCRLRAAPLVAPVAGPNTLVVPGCPPLGVTGALTSASLRTTLKLPPLPASGAPDDRLLVRFEGLGPKTPGPAMATLVWLEGKASLTQEGD